ncbi:PROTEIN SEY1 [Salix purpurea]|uniref:PROTEIN SEY1 n=1 Tax=Salix purpurea TaxID=77065 RepID=A0A9Q0VIN2_SALPP|nr:PROTEIN SEY1 [Salix purpurea]
MAPDCRSFQLISGDGVLNMEGLENFSRTTNLSPRGVSYAVVAIMGPQSGGKSTLLNKLFRTDFRMMDADDGRTQTTRGIWIAKAIGIEPFTIAIDVEGSDSGERGQDGATFEKQSALFAFAIADTVIINMWCHDIGREHAASRPLLKTVFEAMARSFRSSKTSLLFVLRDQTRVKELIAMPSGPTTPPLANGHAPNTPLELLQRLLRQDIEKIWAAIAAADAHKRTHLEEFFNVEITALPSYEFEEKKFTEQVARLRQRFFLSTSPGGLAGDRKDDELASGLPLRAQQIWKTIKKNKDLDLPPPQVLVATFRCEQIAKEKLSRLKLDETWLAMGEALKSGPVSEFGEKLSCILENYLCQYDKEAINYEESIRNENRRKLEAKALKVVRPAYAAMLQHLRSIALKSLQTTVRKASGDGFEAAVDSCCQSIMRDFERGCQAAAIRQVNDWVYLEVNVRESLRRDIETLKSDKKAEYEELIKAQKIKKHVSEGSGILVGVGVATSLVAIGCDQVTAAEVGLAASTSTKRLINEYI